MFLCDVGNEHVPYYGCLGITLGLRAPAKGQGLITPIPLLPPALQARNGLGHFWVSLWSICKRIETGHRHVQYPRPHGLYAEDILTPL